VEWWTFAGLATNQTIVQYLHPFFNAALRADNLWINLPRGTSVEQLKDVIQRVQSANSLPNWNFEQPAADLLKFGDLLPEHLLRDMIMARIADVPHANTVLHSRITVVDC
jgi:hypothetical protein